MPKQENVKNERILNAFVKYVQGKGNLPLKVGMLTFLEDKKKNVF